MTEDQWTAFVEKYSALEHSYDSQEWVYTDKIEYNVLLESGTIVDQIERALYDVCSLCKAVKPALKDGQPITEITNHKLEVEARTFENTNIKWYEDLTEDELEKYGFVAAEEGGEAVNADKISKSGYVNISCSQEATLYFVCVDTNCDIKHNDEVDNAIQIVLPALDHVWVDGEITTPATCTEPGVMSTKCSICETAGDPKDIPATNHNWVKDEERSKPATCEVNGVIYYVCANEGCDAEYSEEIIASHDWVTIPGTERVQWISGNLDYHNRIWMEKCSICGKEREQTEAEDHAKRYYNAEEVAQDDELSQELFEFYGVRVVEHAKYGFVFTTAACDDPGPVVNVCECGHIELVPNTSVSPQDHTWEVTEIAPEDPCLGVTIKHKECKWCDAEVEVPLGDPAGHTWVVVEQVDPTCDTNGWEGFAYCEECGKVIMFEASAEETEPDKMSIDYVEGVTCDGTDASIEAVKDLEGISIGALGHEWSEAPKQFCTDGCLNPVWEVTYCERCFNYDNEGDFTTKPNGPEYPAGDEGYVDTDFGAASDEFIEKLLDVLNWAGRDDVPPVSFTKEDLTSDAFNGHYNITGIKYVAAKGHTLTEYQSAYDVGTTTWSYSETKAAVCVVDKNLDSYDDALAFAKVVAQAALGTKYNKTEFETDFAAAFDEIFGVGASDNTSFVIPTDGTKPALAGVCSKCGLPIAVTEHEEVYNMYVVTNGVNGAAYVPGEEIDYNTAHVHADDPNTTTVDEARYYVVDKDGVLRVNPDGTPIGMSNAEIAAQSVYSKAVYTYEEVKAWGFTNDNGSVNCYFYSFCVNCGKAMGTTNNHTFPTSNNWNKYHNCMQGDICFWCDKVISTVMGHNMQDLEEIAASENERYEAAAAELYAEAEANPDTYDWVGKDTVEDIPCHDEDGNVQYAEKWDIQVCVSCLVAWAEGNLNFKGWTEIDKEDPDNDGNFSSIFEKQEGKHNFKPVDQDGNLVTGEEELDSSAHNCLTGYGVRYICQDPNCNYVLTYEDQQSGKFDYTKDFEELKENNYIAETYKESVPHTVAPVVNYTEAGNNYIAPTTDHAAYMNFICIKCGETLQGNYGEGNLDEDGTALDYYRYNMATDEDIAAYTEAGSVYGEVEAAAESDRAPLPEATEPVVPPVGGGDETEQGGEGGAGAGAGAGADAGAGDGTV